jgi:NAD(P)-dependent dehydrogenase (short-subunit alcohol dehydrogenase family)
LITGVTSGLGRAFAMALLDAGYRVVGTARSLEGATAFSDLKPGQSFGLLLDVTQFAAVAAAVEQVEAKSGPIEVLVNNAGYGFEGILEESSLEQLRQQFETNVFGAVAMIKAVLPGMRSRRSGRIVNVTSMGGFITMPGISYYCGSKFALEGISEALAKEVRTLGIFVTALAPGQFRTDWAGRSMVRGERAIEDYDAIMDPLREARKKKSGLQPGDPDKAAQALLTLIREPNPPMHLYLGADALGLVEQKLSDLACEIDLYRALSLSTGFATAG